MNSGPFFAFGLMQRDARRQSPACNRAVDMIPDLSFQYFQLSRQVDRNLALLPVHGAQFDGNLETVFGAFAPTVSGHRFHRRICWSRSRKTSDRFLILILIRNPNLSSESNA